MFCAFLLRITKSVLCTASPGIFNINLSSLSNKDFEIHKTIANASKRKTTKAVCLLHSRKVTALPFQ